MKYERTLIAIKPDGVQRGLIGEIISRFERSGMKLMAAKFIAPTLEQIKQHYNATDEWLVSTGTNTLKGYAKRGIKLNKTAKEVGLSTWKKLLNYWTNRPTMVMIWEGPNAVEIARKLIGHTSPHQADVGSIRGDYCLESYIMADELERALYNLVHASGSIKEAEYEIKLWFKKEEILDYQLFIEELVHNKDWGKVK